VNCSLSSSTDSGSYRYCGARGGSPRVPDSVTTILKYGATWQAASVVVAAALVVAAAETTVEVMSKLEELELELELDELDELDELGVREAVLSREGGPLATANSVTTLQVEPRLYWNLGVKTARTPLQSSGKSVYFPRSARTWVRYLTLWLRPLLQGIIGTGC
jgi:hypothetical protein